MTVLSLLYEALRGKRARGSVRDLSLAGAMTAGLYEVSRAMSTPGEEVQRSLDLIVSAATSILRVERVVLLLKVPGEERLALRSLAGIHRPKAYDKYRQEIHDSIFEQVIATGEGMVISEGKAGGGRRILSIMRRLAIKGFIVAPVKRPAGIVGVLVAASPMDGRDISQTDLKLLSVMANFAGVALENAHLVARLERKAKKLTAIFEVSRALNEETDPKVLFQLIIDRAAEIMGASSGSMILLDRRGGVLRIVAERGLGGRVKEEIKLRLGEGITGWVAQEGTPVLVPDVRKDPRYVEVNPRVRSEMAVPIRWGVSIVGVLNLDHYECEAFAEEDLELLIAFGNVAAVALRNVRVIDEGAAPGKSC